MQKKYDLKEQLSRKLTLREKRINIEKQIEELKNELNL